jgi:hypothetical protein
MAYHHFKDENGQEYGSFEVFHNDWVDPEFVLDPEDPEAGPAPIGWYWVAGFPGCLWDGSPQGPFESEAAAIMDARGESQGH